jgi:catechol 2,3-dioxygenase
VGVADEERDEQRLAAFGIPPAEGRLPAATRVGRVRLQVGDLGRSLDYYGGVLGLRVVAAVPGRAELAAHGGSEPLVELHERPGARPAPRGRRHGLYHFALLVPGRPALGRFLGHLAGLGIAPGAADHLVSESLYLWDPDGLGIEVYADRPRSAWRARGRELAMDTLPLDRAAVLGAAGEERWAGMPGGTAVGHLHLQVGDLERATAFYHRALGLDLTVWSYPGARFLAAGGYHHHLGTNTWADPGATPPVEDEARLLDWELVLPGEADLAAVAARLERHGHAAAAADPGPRRVADPWGTHLVLRAAVP